MKVDVTTRVEKSLKRVIVVVRATFVKLNETSPVGTTPGGRFVVVSELAFSMLPWSVVDEGGRELERSEGTEAESLLE